MQKHYDKEKFPIWETVDDPVIAAQEHLEDSYLWWMKGDLHQMQSTQQSGDSTWKRFTSSNYLN